MQNPSLEEKIDGLFVETQIKFYDLLDEKLNLTHPRPHPDHLMDLMRDCASMAIAGTNPRRDSGEEPSGATVTAEGMNEYLTDNTSKDDGSRVDYSSPDDRQHPQDETDASVDEPVEIPLQPDEPPADEAEFADQPFTVYEGSMFSVLSDYPKEKPHYRLVSSTLVELRAARKSCYLECHRSVSSRIDGQDPKKGSKSDWRLWLTFTCPLRRVKVKSSEKGDACRIFYDPSATIPPDVIDDWIVALSSRPCLSSGVLRKMATQKSIAGGYCALTTEFLTQKGLGNYEAVREAIRSIKSSKGCGLSVAAFTRSLLEMGCGEDRLKGEAS
ncbi:hypothetical protein FOL47_001814, partial [Perkinsus chesapeaki]